MEQDKIFQIKNAKFYLPNYPEDCISSSIVSGNDYWDKYALKLIDKYLPQNATILDIGANVGSHTIYWALERFANKIYSFEPFKQTFDILSKNIELNNLKSKVVLSDKGLSNQICKAKVKTFTPFNVGGTSFAKDKKGDFEFVPLDILKIPEKIDLIKIDVEGHEIETLEGAKETIYKSKPVIVIESFNKKEKVDEILFSMGYELVDTIRKGEDYIYQYNDAYSLYR